MELNQHAQKEELDIIFKFPGYCSKRKAGHFTPDDSLFRSIAYIYDDRTYLYIGFAHEDINKHANNDFNLGSSGQYFDLFECLRYLSKSLSAKVRLGRFEENKEGYFFNFGDVMYYREQLRVPEQIWGETPNA